MSCSDFSCIFRFKVDRLKVRVVAKTHIYLSQLFISRMPKMRQCSCRIIGIRGIVCQRKPLSSIVHSQFKNICHCFLDHCTSVIMLWFYFGATSSYNRWQNCWEGVTSENKTIPTPSPPLHSKLRCSLFSADSTNSGATLRWEGRGGKALIPFFILAKS